MRGAVGRDPRAGRIRHRCYVWTRCCETKIYRRGAVKTTREVPSLILSSLPSGSSRTTEPHHRHASSKGQTHTHTHATHISLWPSHLLLADLPGAFPLVRAQDVRHGSVRMLLRGLLVRADRLDPESDAPSPLVARPHDQVHRGPIHAEGELVPGMAVGDVTLALALRRAGSGARRGVVAGTRRTIGQRVRRRRTQRAPMVRCPRRHDTVGRGGWDPQMRSVGSGAAGISFARGSSRHLS